MEIRREGVIRVFRVCNNFDLTGREKMCNKKWISKRLQKSSRLIEKRTENKLFIALSFASDGSRVITGSFSK